MGIVLVVSVELVAVGSGVQAFELTGSNECVLKSLVIAR